MSKVSQEQANKFGMTLVELEKLAEGKECSVYPNELLHVRRGKGGKVVVFNISEKARGEKISATKKAKKQSQGAESTGTVTE